MNGGCGWSKTTMKVSGFIIKQASITEREFYLQTFNQEINNYCDYKSFFFSTYTTGSIVCITFGSQEGQGRRRVVHEATTYNNYL